MHHLWVLAFFRLKLLWSLIDWQQNNKVKHNCLNKCLANLGPQPTYAYRHKMLHGNGQDDVWRVTSARYNLNACCTLTPSSRKVSNRLIVSWPWTYLMYRFSSLHESFYLLGFKLPPSTVVRLSAFPTLLFFECSICLNFVVHLFGEIFFFGLDKMSFIGIYPYTYKNDPFFWVDMNFQTKFKERNKFCPVAK